MKLTLSNSFIIISTIFTLVSFQNPELINYGMHSYYLLWSEYTKTFIQFCFYSFLHADLQHLIFNSLFIFIFWNKVETLIGKQAFLQFFILTALFDWVFILLFSDGINMWISGFGMALLSYYTLKLYEIKDPDYKWWITGIIIGSIIGFSTNISVVGHFFWAVFGAIYYFILKIIKRS